MALEYSRLSTSYTWKAKNGIQLLDDVVRFSKYPEYRIGTIILHYNGNTLDIFDGQQKIITSLLIARYLTEKITYTRK
ncbi:GmrSD restriction endonuclease domain-containing protein [Peptostreptococcus sp.]